MAVYSLEYGPDTTLLSHPRSPLAASFHMDNVSQRLAIAGNAMLGSPGCGTPSDTCALHSRTRARKDSRIQTCLSSFLQQVRHLQRRAFGDFLSRRRDQRREALSPPVHSSTWPVRALRKHHRSPRDKVSDMCARRMASSHRKLRHSSSQSRNRCLNIFWSPRAYRRSRFVLVPCACRVGKVQHGR